MDPVIPIVAEKKYLQSSSKHSSLRTRSSGESTRNTEKYLF